MRFTKSSAVVTKFSSNTHPTVIASRSARRFTTVANPDEVEKFSAMSTQWWDPDKNPLIAMNVIRTKYIQQQLYPSGLRGLSALDVGCGGGLLSESLARLGAHVTAVDPSRALVEAAKQHSQLDLRTQSIEYLPGMTIQDVSTDRMFDIVCLLEVIEHVPDPFALVQEAARRIQPGGKLFLSTMDRTIKSYLLTILGAEYLTNMIQPGTHNWNQYLSPQQVKAMTHEAGLVQLDACGMTLSKPPPPLGRKWQWQLDPTDTDVNWIGTYQKPMYTSTA